MTHSPLAAKAIPLHLLQLNCSIYDQLRIEEALLRVDDRNWCIINRCLSPAIVMGISGKRELLINDDKISQAPVPLIRRFSGGGTVFIDQNTYMLTWICNSAAIEVDCYPQHVHQWTVQFYKNALTSLDVELRENDYVINDRKFGGNAQYFRKDRWLHHSSLLWDFDVKNMDYLLIPPKMPQYRQQRGHEHFLCRLKEFYSEWEGLNKSILETLHRQFHVKLVEVSDVQDLLSGEHRKATQFV